MFVPSQGRPGQLRAYNGPGGLRAFTVGTCCWCPHAGDHTSSQEATPAQETSGTLTTLTLFPSTVLTKMRFLYLAEEYKAKLFLLMRSSHEENGCGAFFPLGVFFPYWEC